MAATLTATDVCTQLTGTATQAVALLPPATPSAGASAPATGSPVGQPAAVPPTQVTFLCTGLQVGNATTSVLPSAYGITCIAPKLTVSPGADVPVQVTVQTTAATALAAASQSRSLRPAAPADPRRLRTTAPPPVP